jgi:hypothetical protein
VDRIWDYLPNFRLAIGLNEVISHQSRIAPGDIEVRRYYRFSASTAVNARHIRIYAFLFYGLGFKPIAVTQTNSILAATLERARLLRLREKDRNGRKNG